MRLKIIYISNYVLDLLRKLYTPIFMGQIHMQMFNILFTQVLWININSIKWAIQLNF
jgi:hypothetical protein